MEQVQQISTALAWIEEIQSHNGATFANQAHRDALAVLAADYLRLAEKLSRKGKAGRPPIGEQAMTQKEMNERRKKTKQPAE